MQINPVQIIPVIDLLGGVVVRGIAGRRSEYQPIRSRLCPSAAPAAVAHALLELGLSELYLADLDAIAGASPAWRICDELLAAGAKLWIDAGTGDAQRAQAMSDFAASRPGVSGIVIGLESVADPADLAHVARLLPPDRRIFSLDLKHGRALAGPDWADYDVPAIAERAVSLCIGRLIVLDLAQVGVNAGPGTLNLCRELHARYPQVQLIGGGGVRGRDDLAALAGAGCSAALVASALHDGRIGPGDFTAT